MKIYILHLKPATLNLATIEKYFTQKTTSTLLFSPDGLYQITNNLLYKLIPHDEIVEEYSIIDNTVNTDNTIALIFDKSYYSKIKEISQIPFQHVVYTYENFEYKLYTGSKISLIIQKMANVNNDVYFLCDNNIQLSEINEDIITFLSLIKNI